MMTLVCRIRSVCLLVALIVGFPEIGRAMPGSGCAPAADSGSRVQRERQVLLSLEIARVRKDARRVSYFMSIARQQKTRRRARKIPLPSLPGAPSRVIDSRTRSSGR